MGPVPEAGRILALDAARGFALLGILFVNIQFFAMPFGSWLDLDPPDGTLNAAAHYFTKIFCQGKFYPLFSMMFGIGLVLQRRRAEERGVRFGGVYARRLLVLATLGALHGLLFWYGDILFLYSIAGLVLLLASRLPWKGLIAAGCGVLVWAMILIAAMSLFTGMSMQAQEAAQEQGQETTTGELTVNEDGSAVLILESDSVAAAAGTDAAAQTPTAGITPAGADSAEAVAADTPAADVPVAEAAEPSEPAAGPARELFRLYQSRTIQGGPEHPEYMRLETEAYRDGPYLDAFIFRSMSFFFILLFAALGFGWTVLASFFFGAALYKFGLFEEHRLGVAKIGVAVGLCVGLPIVLAGQWAVANTSVVTALPLMGVTEAVGGLLMAFGYLCVMILLGHARSPIAKLLAPLGRMALTCYLLQTLLATAIFYHWGLGKFGSMDRAQMVLVVLGIYIFEIGLAHLWLSRFKMGPMEWLWRRLTYMSPVPMTREEKEAA